jgi:hypothetical protein
MKNIPQPAQAQHPFNLAALRRSFEELVASRKSPTTTKASPVQESVAKGK